MLDLEYDYFLEEDKMWVALVIYYLFPVSIIRLFNGGVRLTFISLIWCDEGLIAKQNLH